VTGEGEEDVVEGRPAHRHVVDPDPGLVQSPHGVGDRAPALADRHAQDAVGEGGTLRRDRRQRRDRRLGVGLGFERDVEALAADLVLQLVGAALGDDPAAVDDGDAVGEAVGLVEVLGGEQDGGAGGDPPFDRLPEGDAAARVEPRGRLVEERTGGRATSAAARSSRRRIPPE
jgi:hypothetical protein